MLPQEVDTIELLAGYVMNLQEVDMMSLLADGTTELQEAEMKLLLVVNMTKLQVADAISPLAEYVIQPPVGRQKVALLIAYRIKSMSCGSCGNLRI
jgi:hypothetical protein